MPKKSKSQVIAEEVISKSDSSIQSLAEETLSRAELHSIKVSLKKKKEFTDKFDHLAQDVICAIEDSYYAKLAELTGVETNDESLWNQ